MSVDSESTADTRFMRLPELMTRVGLGRSKIYEMMAEGEFPKPIKLGRASVWPNHIVEQWMSKQMSAA